MAFPEGTHPAAPLRDPLGDVAVQDDADHKAGHLAQKACQAALVDVLGQAVAETQEGHHSAPVDAALKQAVSRGYPVSGSPASLAHTFPCPFPRQKAKWLSCESRQQRLPQSNLNLGGACVSEEAQGCLSHLLLLQGVPC